MESYGIRRFALASCISLMLPAFLVAESIEVKDSAASTQPLPEAVASFGAVTCDGWIYVYSGHIGTAHDHSKQNLSQSFRRRPVQGGAWEQLPMETPLQGLALVAHEGRVYRVGGMTAGNESANEDAKLYSMDAFARFDPGTKQWEHLARLPAGRSSHDAVVIGSKIYVVGGWNLDGGDEGEWHTDVVVFDLSTPDRGWVSIQQPFERRALAATHFRGKLYVIGGMNESHDIDRSVNVFDPATGSWTQGPEFRGEGMNGFGASAWNNGHALLASGSNGVVYRLSDDGARWQEAARLVEPRFFHQIVPGLDGELLVLGGASRKGHLQNIERISLDN